MIEPAGNERPFIALIAWLRDFGSACDAADRGYHDEAERIGAEASAGVRALMDAHPSIGEALPDLRQHVDGTNPFFDSAEFIERAKACIQAIRECGCGAGS
ncbi:MAG: hypothetical protein QOD39_2517 [Mycobacterium sp.]|jgi:hypothetical protein|nr:hypothetical protein [Mycobacterium sp.]